MNQKTIFIYKQLTKPILFFNYPSKTIDLSQDVRIQLSYLMFKRIKSQSLIQPVSRNLFSDNKQPSLRIDRKAPQQLQDLRYILIQESQQQRPQTILRVAENSNKNRSKSSKNIFRNARSVQKGQTFIRSSSKSQVESMNSMMMRSEELQNKKKILQKAQKQMNKKMAIKELMQNPKLLLSKHPKMSRLLHLQSEQLPKTSNYNPIGESAITVQLGQSQQFDGSLRDHFTQSKKFTSVEYQTHTEYKDHSHLQIQEDKNKSVGMGVSVQLFNTHFQTLQKNLQQSIKTQLRKATEVRQQKMSKNLEQKEQQYLKKMNSMFQQISSQLQNQKQLIQKMASQIEPPSKKESLIIAEPMRKSQQKQQSKGYLQMKQSQLQPAALQGLQQKARSTTKSPPGKKQPIIAQGTRTVKEKSVENYNKVLQKEQQKQQRSFEKLTGDKNVSKKQDKLPVKQESVNLGQKQKSKVQERNYWNEKQDDFLSGLEEIKLTTQSKQIPPRNIAKPNAIDRSFNVPPSQLNNSFESEPPPKQQPKKTTKATNKDPSQIASEKQSVADARKTKLRNIIKQEQISDPYLTELGKVVIDCSKCMKKSTLDWRVPSLLLYRYCYDSYTYFIPFYEEALKLGILSETEVQEFRQEVGQIKQTMQKKILPVTIKKVFLPPQYKALIESQQREIEALRPFVDTEVIQFITALNVSDQLKDSNVAKCGLRMINALLIIRKLSQDSQIKVLQNIDSIKDDKAQPLFRQWMVQFQKIWRQQNKR